MGLSSLQHLTNLGIYSDDFLTDREEGHMGHSRSLYMHPRDWMPMTCIRYLEVKWMSAGCQMQLRRLIPELRICLDEHAPHGQKSGDYFWTLDSCYRHIFIDLIITMLEA